MKLVVGLGNPGRRYEGTRHNIGYAVLAELARRFGAGPAEGAVSRRGGRGRLERPEGPAAEPDDLYEPQRNQRSGGDEFLQVGRTKTCWSSATT